MTSQSTATGIPSVYVKCRNLISFKTPFPSPVYNWFNNFFHTENQIRCFCFQSSNIIKKNSKTEETSIVFPCVFALLGPSFFLIFQDFFCHLLSLSRTFSSNHVRVGLLMTNSTSFSLRVSWFLLHSLRIIFPDMEIGVDILFFFFSPSKDGPQLMMVLLNDFLMLFLFSCPVVSDSLRPHGL